ncbi:MAG UNVERIFIED_CONTAM: serine/threonine protein kinase [Planctomycetaceae bacterium]|jgi:serine/threonine protein kinase
MKFTFAPESRPLEGYTIKRAIHRGGFGEVYFAMSEAGRQVALKLLNNNLEVELRGVKQCLNLNHPNLVTIFDIRQDTDRDYWIVMEYVGGSSLLDVLQRHPSGMPLPDILRWLSGMAQGLAFLHDRGLVHRDLKPANVLSDGEQVKIGDVGLSKYISESRRSAQTQSVGTVYYMAPEVSRGRYGREVDVYALGVMLIEMLTGQLPFDGETTAEILMKHLTAEPDLSMLSPPLQQVLRGALEKDPDRRIQDVLELQRRFCEAVEAPVAVPEPRANHHAAEAFAETLPGPSVAARPAPQPVPLNQPAVVGDRPSYWKSLQQFWQQLPEPLRWVVMGAVLLSVVRSEVLIGSEEVVAGGARLCRLVSVCGQQSEEKTAGRGGSSEHSTPCSDCDACPSNDEAGRRVAAGRGRKNSRCRCCTGTASSAGLSAIGTTTAASA